MEVAELFNLLESNQPQIAEDIKKTFHEHFNATKESWLVNGLFDYYLSTGSVRTVEILVGVREPHDKYLFDRLCESFRGTSKLQALTLLGHVVRRQPTWLYKVTQHPLLRDLLKLLKVETDILPLMSALLVVIVLLPMIAGLMEPYLQDIFQVFSRLAEWNTNNPNKVPEVHLLHLQMGLYALFHRLYGMYPCNFLSYLRHQYSLRDKLAIFSHTIKVPNVKEWEAIQVGFNDKWNFPGCCGAIDGKHILIKAPPSAGSEYYNYKGTNSIVLLAVVDHDYCFRYIDVGSYGRNADGGVFQCCNLYPLLENDSLLPKGGVLVGDDAFHLKTYLLKPYSKPNLTKEERIYNYRTSRARRIVENAFGILASRFRIFGQALAVKVETTKKLVKAACAIHNWLRFTSSASYTPPGSFDYKDIVNASVVQGQWRSEISQLPSILHTRHYNRPKKIAQQVRERYKEYFSREWSVEWQDRMIQ